MLFSTQHNSIVVNVGLPNNRQPNPLQYHYFLSRFKLVACISKLSTREQRFKNDIRMIQHQRKR